MFKYSRRRCVEYMGRHPATVRVLWVRQRGFCGCDSKVVEVVVATAVVRRAGEVVVDRGAARSTSANGRL
jgi:hypothetical protein